MSSVGAPSTPVTATARKRPTACLHCRRQKLKCDVAQSKPCTRCREEDVECVVKPRANAAILTDDLRWQQSVETRFQNIHRELEVLRNGQPSTVTLPTPVTASQTTPITSLPPPIPPISFPINIAPIITVPPHLIPLRNVLSDPLNNLQNGKVEMTADEAALLWEYFYNSLAIYHGFVAGLTVTAPSPLLLTAIAAAATARWADPHVNARHALWKDLFHQALTDVITGGPKSWDDTVALCVARTWFWTADSTTTGLIYGTFIDTLSPNTADLRSRRVWDFMQITAISHSVFHLGLPIIPDRPPGLVPPRQYPHVLFGALTDLFDILGVLPRALVDTDGLIDSLLRNRKGRPWSYAETLLLKTSLSEIDKWGAKWNTAIHATPEDALPGGKPKRFLLDLVALYYQAAMLIVNGYLQQGTEQLVPQYTEMAKGLVHLVVDTWSDSLRLWPKVLLDAALLGAVILDPQDPIGSRVYSCFTPLVPLLSTSGSQLYQALHQRFQTSPGDTFMQSLDPIPMPHTGSDAFWDDLLGVLQVDKSQQWR